MRVEKGLHVKKEPRIEKRLHAEKGPRVEKGLRARKGSRVKKGPRSSRRARASKKGCATWDSDVAPSMQTAAPEEKPTPPSRGVEYC
ncbi:hypothetical protein COLSTE_00221 [Collinsella stercoris DSM 13279]|uniref:Uncharacterized protein n=1 Tax=Collinsella stercoris DSM 13279 TaxID=445975 RepID=B6G831_9ACTN|nr:hypothetical protein COLSTE_00221 [Collinsella stercoris DSM 13279]